MATEIEPADMLSRAQELLHGWFSLSRPLRSANLFTVRSGTRYVWTDHFFCWACFLCLKPRSSLAESIARGDGRMCRMTDASYFAAS